MRYLIGLFMTAIVISSAGGGQGRMQASNRIESCSENPDRLYDRQNVLERLAEILDNAAPGFRKYESSGFYVEDEKPRLFFVYDLTYTSNKGTSLSCITN